MPKKTASKGSGKPIPQVEVNLKLSPKQAADLLKLLQVRFEENMDRHPALEWSQIQAKLEAHSEKLSSLHSMESTGGEPDVIGFDKQTAEFIFCDCSAETPAGRRSICFDGKGQAERVQKGIHPGGNAVDLADAMGLELLDEGQYRTLQTLGEFDPKPRAGSRRPRRSGSSAAGCSLTGATTRSLSITTGPNPFIPAGGFAGC